MNDPNGLVFHDGEYHLFYQHHPASSVWGPMHWGHAVSRDLVCWTHLPIALYPDGGNFVFSGSAVVDDANRSGFGAGAMVMLFTNHDSAAGQAGSHSHESQHLAFSRDKGRSWTRFDGNPVLPNPGAVKDFRDPKLVWHGPSQTWVMALAVYDHAEFWAYALCQGLESSGPGCNVGPSAIDGEGAAPLFAACAAAALEICCISRRSISARRGVKSKAPALYEASIVFNTATYSSRFWLNSSGRIVLPGSHPPSFKQITK